MNVSLYDLAPKCRQTMSLRTQKTGQTACRIYFCSTVQFLIEKDLNYLNLNYFVETYADTGMKEQQREPC